jgi:hypothetical protein
MNRTTVSFSLLAILFGLFSNATGQDEKQRESDKEAFTIHIRELTKPEKVVPMRISDVDTVIDAVGSLKPQPANLLQMDMWIVRLAKDGKPQMLRVDWARIVKQGETKTNFQICPGDRIILQARFPK